MRLMSDACFICYGWGGGGSDDGWICVGRLCHDVSLAVCVSIDPSHAPNPPSISSQLTPTHLQPIPLTPPFQPPPLHQEEYIKDEMKNLKRELIRATEEVKRIQVPLRQPLFVW